MMQVMQTGVAMLRHLDRQLAWLSPGCATPARGAAAAPAAPVVDANTSASTERKAVRRGINCGICKGPVPAPRYRYCGDDCKAEGLRRREVKNSREYRKRKNEEKRKRNEATIARIKRRGAS
jgi:hypothetical protein